jgi:hypothetical protein
MANDGTIIPTTMARSWVPVGRMLISSTEYCPVDLTQRPIWPATQVVH